MRPVLRGIIGPDELIIIVREPDGKKEETILKWAIQNRNQ